MTRQAGRQSGLLAASLQAHAPLASYISARPSPAKQSRRSSVPFSSVQFRSVAFSCVKLRERGSGGEILGATLGRLRMNKLIVAVGSLAALAALVSLAQCQGAEVESAVLSAQAAPQQEESYQRVYEAFTKLMQNVSNNSLGNVRRLVSRLNSLVGGPGAAGGAQQPQPQAQPQPPSPTAAAAGPKEQAREQSIDEKTEQILNRLDKVNRDTDQHTLSQLNDDISKLIGTLNESYLRNIRRLIERVNKVVGQPSGGPGQQAAGALHQSGDRLDDQNAKLPGFPGWDELIVAVDRMQKSLAHFVRSSTRLVTSG